MGQFREENLVKEIGESALISATANNKMLLAWVFEKLNKSFLRISYKVSALKYLNSIADLIFDKRACPKNIQ